VYIIQPYTYAYESVSVASATGLVADDVERLATVAMDASRQI